MKKKYITPSILIVYPKMRICKIQVGSPVSVKDLQDGGTQYVGDAEEE